jgi:hypothetical protein
MDRRLLSSDVDTASVKARMSWDLVSISARAGRLATVADREVLLVGPRRGDPDDLAVVLVGA